MKAVAAGKLDSFLPDFDAVRRHRRTMRQSIEVSDEGVSRTLQIAILESLDRTDVKILEFLDEIRMEFHALDMSVYTSAIRQLDHDGRTLEQNLAFLRYQQEAQDEMYQLVESVSGAMDRVDAVLSGLGTIMLADIGRQPGSRPEDRRGSTIMNAARCAYLDEVKKMLVPVRFFGQTRFDSGEDVIGMASLFQGQVDELGGYLSKIREQWLG